MILDAQGTVFTFNGSVVGKIAQYTFADGTVEDIEFQDMTTAGVRFFPGKPEYGQLTLTLYRDTSDAGQEAIAAGISGQLRVPCTLKLKDGRMISFTGYGKQLPISGLIDNVNTSNVIIKITGDITES